MEGGAGIDFGKYIVNSVEGLSCYSGELASIGK